MAKEIPKEELTLTKIRLQLNDLVEIAGSIEATEGKDESTREITKVRGRISIRTALEILSLALKYLIFDLEATRRENAYLKKLLKKCRGN